MGVSQGESEFMYMQGRMQSCGQDGAIFDFHAAVKERAQSWGWAWAQGCL